MGQPVIGSNEWMVYTTRSVHQVYDGNNILTVPVYLVSRDGKYLTDKATGKYLIVSQTKTLGDLVRLI